MQPCKNNNVSMQEKIMSNTNHAKKKDKNIAREQECYLIMQTDLEQWKTVTKRKG